jgi:hypothetical protein
MSDVRTRQKWAKKRSLHGVNEHFLTIFNAVMAARSSRAKVSSRVYSSRRCAMNPFEIVKSFTRNLGSVSRTNQLAPDMSPNEVKALLGEPTQTQFSANKWVWEYSLHQYWKGWIPYYLVFDNTTQKLETWYADEREYLRNQQLWLQAFAVTQKNLDPKTAKPSQDSGSLNAQVAQNAAWNSSNAGNWSSRS